MGAGLRRGIRALPPNEQRRKSKLQQEAQGKKRAGATRNRGHLLTGLEQRAGGTEQGLGPGRRAFPGDGSLELSFKQQARGKLDVCAGQTQQEG